MNQGDVFQETGYEQIDSDQSELEALENNLISRIVHPGFSDVSTVATYPTGNCTKYVLLHVLTYRTD